MIYYKHLCTIVALSTMLCLSVTQVNAQDPHFSQFYAAPLLVSPALAGTYEGTFRAGAIYRDQWTSALDNPLSTFLISGDVIFDVASRTQKVPDKFSVGLSFYSDRVSTYDLNTNQISLYSSYHKVINERKRTYIGAGVQVGMMQRSVNYEDLFFQDQFNSLNGYTFSTGEDLPANNLGHLDLGLGLSYSTTPRKGTQYYASAGLYHISGSNISFYASDERVDDNLQRQNTLHSRVTLHAGMSSYMTKLLQFQPRVLYMAQGPHTELDFGANFRYKVEAADAQYLHFGPWLRVTDNVMGWGMESLVLAAAYETGSIILGFSYDHNLRDIVTDRLGLNAFEISITFIGEHENDTDICPKF